MARAMYSGLVPTLRFERVGDEIKLESAWRFSSIEYNSKHDQLVAADGCRLVAINPKESSCRLLHHFQGASEIYISCIVPGSGDIVVGVTHRELRFHFHHYSMATGELREISLAEPEKDLRGFEPQRLIYLENGDRIIFASGVEEGALTYSEAGHFDQNWKLLEWTDSCIDRTTFVPCNGEGLFDSSGHGLVCYDFKSRATVVLAGCEEDAGCRDGVGVHARFGELRMPTVNSRYLYVRTEGRHHWEWRLVRLNLKTLEVDSVRIQGVDHWDLLNFCASEDHLYALREASVPAGGEYRVELLRAPLGERDGEAPGLVADLSSVDLRADVRPVSFRLASGAVLQVDRRLLMARSEYFRKMLSCGLQEDQTSEVNLTSDLKADEASVSVMLNFVLSDAWVGPKEDMELALRVRDLADRYQLPRLLRLAEVLLHGMLGPKTVLPLLGRVLDSGGDLERACWELMDVQGPQILETHERELDSIIRQQPRLAKRLILWRSESGDGCSKRFRRW